MEYPRATTNNLRCWRPNPTSTPSFGGYRRGSWERCVVPKRDRPMSPIVAVGRRNRGRNRGQVCSSLLASVRPNWRQISGLRVAHTGFTRLALVSSDARNEGETFEAFGQGGCQTPYWLRGAESPADGEGAAMTGVNFILARSISRYLASRCRACGCVRPQTARTHLVLPAWDRGPPARCR